MARKTVWVSSGLLWIFVVALIVTSFGVWQWSTTRAARHLPTPDEEAPFVAPPPFIRAEAAALLDLETGTLLYAHNAFERQWPGSLVKVVALITALKRGSLDDEVRVGGPVSSFSGSLSFNLTEGEQFRLGDLLRMMFYRPGHDAAVAVAVHTAGSIEAFARQMNVDADHVGATASHFVSPHGFDDGESYATAFDLALIAADALGDARFAEIVRSQRIRLIRRGQSRTLLNMNSFLNRRADATGVKTAYAPEVGHSLIGSVERGNTRLLVVTLGSPTAADRFRDASGLLNYGLVHLEALRASPRVPRDRYEVREGDTLSGLAKRFGVPVVAILDTNEIADPDDLMSGQVLWIPR